MLLRFRSCCLACTRLVSVFTVTFKHVSLCKGSTEDRGASTVESTPSWSSLHSRLHSTNCWDYTMKIQLLSATNTYTPGLDSPFLSFVPLSKGREDLRLILSTALCKEVEGEKKEGIMPESPRRHLRLSH